MEHRDIPATEQHGVVRWLYANEAARDLATVTSADLYKIAQVGVGAAATFFVLTSVAPNVYVQMGSAPTSPYVTGVDFTANTLTLSFSSGPDIAVAGIADTATVGTLDGMVDAIMAALGAVSGIATLDAGSLLVQNIDATKITGTIPAGNLPSYVDDVIEAANFAALPGTGETGKIYITVDDNKNYRWTGSAYVDITGGLSAIATMTLLGNNTGGSAVPAALTQAEVRDFIGRKVQTVANPANGSTIAIDADVSTLFVTGAAISTANLNFNNVADGAQVCMWCQNGISSVILQSSGLTFEGGSTISWTAGVTKVVNRAGNSVTVRELVGPNIEQVVSVATPNATIPVVGFKVVNSAAGVDLLLNPKGVGAIVAQVPNNTSTGGNKRGSRAVDLQRSRSAATQVASGQDSAILAGTNNTASGIRSIVPAGADCVASGTDSLAGGSLSTSSANYSLSWGYHHGVAALAGTAFGYEHILGSTATGGFAAGINHTINGRAGVGFGVYGTDYGVDNCLVYAGENSSGELGARQLQLWMAKRTTTDASVAALTSNGGAVSATNVPSISSDSFRVMRGTVTARKYISDECKVWDVFAVIRNSGGTTTIVSSTVTVLYESAGATAWALAVAVNDATDRYYLNGTGEAATTINWTSALWLGPSFM